MGRVSGSDQQGKLLLPAIIFLFLISAAAGSWYYFNQDKEKTPERSFAAVQRGDIEDLVAATGILQPRDYVEVGAQVSGQLRRIHVEVGDAVEAGDLLAEIDPTLFMAKVDAARAQLRYQQALLKDREAQLELARIQHQRQQNLLAAQATTEESAQNAAASYRSAQAQIDMLMAQIEQNESALRADEANLSYAQIFAPMRGTVVAINARQGQTINASQQAPVILQIADLSTMRVRTRVSEADISRLKTGMDVYFTTLGGGERRWHGQLLRIEPTPTVENNVVLYHGIFDVENSGGQLLPQMTAQVFFVAAAARDALLVPITAVDFNGRRGQDSRRPAEDNGGSGRPSPPESAGRRGTVQIINSQGQAEIRDVRVGVSNRVQVQILEGLSEGDQVVTSARSNARTGGSDQRMTQPGTTRPR